MRVSANSRTAALALATFWTAALAACAAAPVDFAPPPASADFETCIPDADDGPVFKETLTFTGADGATLVRIVRRPGDGPTIGETFAFDLLGFAMQDGAGVTCVVDADQLTYDSQHHNWDETATIEPDDTRTLTLTMTYDVVASTWADALDDTATDENLPLTAAACVSEGPSPANGCFRRP